MCCRTSGMALPGAATFGSHWQRGFPHPLAQPPCRIDRSHHETQHSWTSTTMASICASTATADHCLYKCICEVAASTGSHRSSLSSVSICPCDVGHGRASSATACLEWHRARQERLGSRKAFHASAMWRTLASETKSSSRTASHQNC
ncbi:hypothetical protein GGI42DRAFT_326543 [Trichoderma sp. SZMC 28013]